MRLHRNMKTFLLLVCFAAVAVTHARPCDHAEEGAAHHADVGQELASVLPELSSGHSANAWHAMSAMRQQVDCTTTCDGEPMPNQTKTECWGTFLWVCGNYSSGGMAARCDGHFLGVDVPQQDMYIAACEGLHHFFVLKRTTCPASGASAQHFFGRGCLGGSSYIMQKLPAPASTAALPQEVKAMMGTETEALLAELANLAATSSSSGSSGDLTQAGGVSTQSRCHGRGGEVRAVKRSGSAGAGEPEDVFPQLLGSAEQRFDQVRAAVEAAAGTTALEPAAAAAPAPAKRHSVRGADDDNVDADVGMLDAMLQLASSRSSGSSGSAAAQLLVTAPHDQHHDWSCSITCNDKPAWWHGLWPCWGTLTVSCSSSSSASAAFAAAVEVTEEDVLVEDRSVMLRELQARQPGTDDAAYIRVEPQQQEQQEQQQQQQQQLREGGVTFSASCNGFWTGFLGKTCCGLTLIHSQADWSSGSLDKRDICTGALGVRARREADGASMGHFCKGTEVQREQWMRK